MSDNSDPNVYVCMYECCYIGVLFCVPAGTDGSHVFTDINPRAIAFGIVVTAYGFDKGTPVVEQMRRVFVSKSLME